MPVHLKEHLLSYLSLYGEAGSPDLKTFKLLFSNETEVDGGTGGNEVKQLDLTGLLSDAFTISDLNKYMSRQRSVVDSSYGPNSPPPTSERLEDEIAESWEDDIDSLHHTPLQPFRFPNLTRLSLAHPGNQASWSSLLAACSNLKHLTHLSLAYWPTPSTTPNAATTSMISKHAKPVALGGSHIYSQIDDDWHEAANILRRLSLATYRLRWLDLEGCDWYKALTWDSSNYMSRLRRIQEANHPNEFGVRGETLDVRGSDAESKEGSWATHSGLPGPDWNGAWERVETLVLSQGWVPTNISAIQVMPSGSLSVELLNYLKKKKERRRKKAGSVRNRSLSGSLGKMSLITHSGGPVSSMSPMTTPGGISCGHWVEKEKDIRNVEAQVRLLRKVAKGLRIKVLYGWGEGEEDSEDDGDIEVSER